MNKPIHIGVIKDYFSLEELVYLKEEILDNKILEISQNESLEKFLQKGSFKAYAKRIRDVPVFTKNDKWIIAALLERNLSYQQSLRESIPENGEGIIAIICPRSDHSGRKLLAHLHHWETGYCSNIERKVIKAFSDVRVHCQLDRANRYNLAISIKNENLDKIYYYSQSTFVGLAEKAIKEIKGS